MPKSKKEIKKIEKQTNDKIKNLKSDFSDKIEKVEESVCDKIEKVDYKVIVTQKRINTIDNKIEAIQKSTKTLFKAFNNPHNWLRAKSSWYYDWSLNPRSNVTHWTTLIVAFLAMLFLVGYQLGFFGGMKPASQAAPGIPKMINYQGKLTDTNNVPVPDGSYNLTIRIYDSVSGGTCLWAWKGNCGAPVSVPVTVTNGIFSVMLGDTSYQSTAALNLDFNDDAYFLGVAIGVNPEMTPRKRIGAVGYAYNSDTVDGKHETDFALLAGRSGGQNLRGGTDAGDDLTLESTTDSTKGDVLIQPSGGNVGIGTASPGSTLTVYRATPGIALSVRDTTDTVDSLMVSDTGLITTAGNLVFSAVNPSISASSINTNISLDANGTGEVRIGSTSTGNVLLAGGSGATGCTVDNATGSFSCSGSFSGSSISLSSLVQGSVVYVGASGLLSGDATNFYWNSAAKKLGVGKTSPNQSLEVASSGAADTQISIINTNGGDYNPQLGFQLVDGTNNYTIGAHDADEDKFKICTTALGVNCAFIMDSNGNVEIGTTTGSVTINGTITNSSTPGLYSNLTIRNNSTNPNYQIDINADAITLLDWVNNYSREWRNVSKTVDLSVSGANGLDTGSEAANTWYYLWIIGKSDGTVNGLISASPTSPTMPSGYIYRIRVGSFRNDAASNIIRFNYSEGTFQFRTTINVLTAGDAITPTSVSLVSAVPPVAKNLTAMIGVYSTDNTFHDSYCNASNIANGQMSQLWGRGNDNYKGISQAQLILETAQILFYYNQDAKPSQNVERLDMNIVSYVDLPVAL